MLSISIYFMALYYNAVFPLSHFSIFQWWSVLVNLWFVSFGGKWWYWCVIGPTNLRENSDAWLGSFGHVTYQNQPGSTLPKIYHVIQINMAAKTIITVKSHHLNFCTARYTHLMTWYISSCWLKTLPNAIILPSSSNNLIWPRLVKTIKPFPMHEWVKGFTIFKLNLSTCRQMLWWYGLVVR